MFVFGPWESMKFLIANCHDDMPGIATLRSTTESCWFRGALFKFGLWRDVWRFCPSTPWSPWKSPNTNHKDWNANHLLVAEDCWFGMIWRLPETYPQKNDGNTKLCPNLETTSIPSWRPLVLKGLHSWDISKKHSHSVSVLSFRHNMSHTWSGSWWLGNAATTPEILGSNSDLISPRGLALLGKWIFRNPKNQGGETLSNSNPISGGNIPTFGILNFKVLGCAYVTPL